MKHEFSAQQRASTRQKLKQEHFDLVVIGGGITGAGIIRDAVMRGLKVALIERDDFASGTSSKSSKLVHGGLRYLERFHVALTRESCHERELLLRLNPHLVRAMPFLFPIYRDGRLHPVFIRMGLRFYEFLAGGSAIPHRMLHPNELPELAPTLRTDDLRRAALYYDSTVDDARLVMENIIDAVQRGGLALNYAEVTDFISKDGQICGVKVKDQESADRFEISADQVVNASGIDVDRLRSKLCRLEHSELRASKGVHLVLAQKKLPLKVTTAFLNRADGRLMFAIPWNDVVLVGTTDTFEEADVRSTDSADLDYVLQALNNTYTQGDKITADDVISSIAGVRTLIVPGRGEMDASAVSREHAIYKDDNGLISIAGGKLTTHRIMAQDIVDELVRRLPDAKRSAINPCGTMEEPLSPTVQVELLEQSLRQRFHFTPAIAAQLVRSYGSRVEQVLKCARQDPSLFAPIVPGGNYLRAEIPYLCQHECVLHLDDLLGRRIRLALWVQGQALPQIEAIAALAGESLGWDQIRRDEEIKRYKNYVQEQARPHVD